MICLRQEIYLIQRFPIESNTYINLAMQMIGYMQNSFVLCFSKRSSVRPPQKQVGNESEGKGFLRKNISETEKLIVVTSGLKSKTSLIAPCV